MACTAHFSDIFRNDLLARSLFQRHNSPLNDAKSPLCYTLRIKFKEALLFLRHILTVFFCLALCAASNLWGLPSQVILIRHAEKANPPTYLSLKGRQRAAALVPSFLGSPTLLQYGTPAAVYVMNSGGKTPSIRWTQTAMPLADELNLPLNNRYNRKEIDQLVKEIQETEEYEGKMVLVCWSHGELPKLAALLGATKAPSKWHRDIYDRFWILTFGDDGKVTFEDRPQKLLFGDANK